MSYSQQKHIINKLQVDVATQNPSTAFDLKDHLDTFLKHEIFPYLESYFATIEEDLQDQIIQIPLLTVDVKTSSALNYTELKEDVKRALVKNIEKVTQRANPHNEEATVISTAQSKQKQFLHFLEKGTLPWWSRSEEAFEVSEADFKTLIASKDFPFIIKRKLMKKAVKKRIIQQLSDSQLQQVWKVLVQEETTVSISHKAVTLLAKVSTQMRQIVWNCLLDFTNQKDRETLVSRLLFALLEEVPEAMIETKQVSKAPIAQQAVPALNLIAALLVEIPKSQRTTKALRLIEESRSVLENSTTQSKTASTSSKEVATTILSSEEGSTATSKDETQKESPKYPKTEKTQEVIQQKASQEFNVPEGTTNTDSNVDSKTNKEEKAPIVKSELTSRIEQERSEDQASTSEISDASQKLDQEIKEPKKFTSSELDAENISITQQPASESIQNPVESAQDSRVVEDPSAIQSSEIPNNHQNISVESTQPETSETADSKTIQENIQQQEQQQFTAESTSSKETNSDHDSAAMDSQNETVSQESVAYNANESVEHFSEETPPSEFENTQKEEQNSQVAFKKEETSTTSQKETPSTAKKTSTTSREQTLSTAKEIQPSSEKEVSDAQDSQTIRSKSVASEEVTQEQLQEQKAIKESIDLEKNTIARSEENPTEIGSKEKSIAEGEVTSREEKSKEKETEGKEPTKQEINSVDAIEETKVATAALKTSLQELVDPQDQKLFKELHKSQLENPIKMEERGEYQISNAGLIMLHPYLKPFFENCDLLNDDNTIKDPELAVHLLHYLATKREQQYESNMLFEKILCGVHSSTILQRNVVLSDELKANSEELLKAVLQNWGALKNASPDLLRNEFLQRLGMISFKETNPKIKVERKVYDILLDKLPWGISVCRLPWLDYLLFTDW
jgi:hypothetical protein